MASLARWLRFAWLLPVAATGCAQRSVPGDTRPEVAAGETSGVGAAAVAGPAGWVRPSALAGDWYPSRRVLVSSELARLARFAAHAPTLATKPLALVVPHAGWAYSGAAASAAFGAVHRGEFSRVVIVGPSHHAYLDGFVVSDAAAYVTPLGRVPVCDAARGLAEPDGRVAARSVEAPEHSIEIELPFLQQALGDFCLVPVLIGDTKPAQERELAARLARLDDGRTLFVISSDFVHYGPRFDFTPFGPSAAGARARVASLEGQAIHRLQAGGADDLRAWLDSSGATICGRRGLSVLLELLPRIAPAARSTLLATYSSVDLEPPPGTAADHDNGVWYVALAFERGDGAPAAAAPPLTAPPPAVVASAGSPPLDGASGRALTRVARAALESDLSGSDAITAALAALPDDPALERRQAVFVTLTRRGALRGCVGQLVPEYPLPEAVVRAALAAALEDHRFEPVTRGELASLALEVTVLTPPHPVGSWRDIVLGRHGIVLERDGHRALFLPQVPGEQGWDVKQTLDALANKAGLASDAWHQPRTRFSVFEAQVFEEPRQRETSSGTPRPPESGDGS